MHTLTMQEVRLLSAFRKISGVSREHVVLEVEKLLRPLRVRCRELALSDRFGSLASHQREAVLDAATTEGGAL